eukprot:TRINITY_DN11145_c0_g2_i1.p2 TRINITY_DN11145_c0_g2~~TRINITY_DN11145_c0_g2_i1.p2  ORF type:complete len:197 (-),score=39.59 TRINITY_DN11145_c0_g2_i1:892-1482(-)
MKYQSELLRNIATSIAKNQRILFNPLYKDQSFLADNLDSLELINSRGNVKKHKSVNPRRKEKLMNDFTQNIGVLHDIEIPKSRKRHKKKAKGSGYSGLYYYTPECTENEPAKPSMKKSTFECNESLPEIAERFHVPIQNSLAKPRSKKLELKGKSESKVEHKKAVMELTEDELKLYGNRFPAGYQRLSLLGKYVGA